MALFHVRMDVTIPNDLDPEVRADTLPREKAYSQELQRSGTWRELWRIVGQYSNISIFDVGSGDELHEILQGLPLFPYMDIEVMALTRHPSRIE